MPPPEENVPTPENPAPPPSENLPPENPASAPGENPPPAPQAPAEHHESPSEYDLPSPGDQASGNQAQGGQTPPPHNDFPPPGNPGPFCPNCHQPYDPTRQFCPHCGFMVNPVPQPKFLAGSAVVDVILALLLCVVCAPAGVTTIIPLITYFVVHKEYVAFRKGLAAGLIVYAVLILGMLAFCGWFFFALAAGEKH